MRHGLGAEGLAQCEFDYPATRLRLEDPERWCEIAGQCSTVCPRASPRGWKERCLQQQGSAIDGPIGLRRRRRGDRYMRHLAVAIG